MDHHGSAADQRSAFDIMVEARALQARHAPRALGAAARWIRLTFARLSGKPDALSGRLTMS